MFLIHSRISFFRNVRKWKNCVNWIENKKKKMSGTSKFSRNLDVPDIFVMKKFIMTFSIHLFFSSGCVVTVQILLYVHEASS